MDRAVARSPGPARALVLVRVRAPVGLRIVSGLPGTFARFALRVAASGISDARVNAVKPSKRQNSRHLMLPNTHAANALSIWHEKRASFVVLRRESREPARAQNAPTQGPEAERTNAAA